MRRLLGLGPSVTHVRARFLVAEAGCRASTFGGLLDAASLLGVREYPSEGARYRALAPARRVATAFERAHLLAESAERREEQIYTDHPRDESPHHHTVRAARSGRRTSVWTSRSSL